MYGKALKKDEPAKLLETRFSIGLVALASLSFYLGRINWWREPAVIESLATLETPALATTAHVPYFLQDSLSQYGLFWCVCNVKCVRINSTVKKHSPNRDP